MDWKHRERLFDKQAGLYELRRKRLTQKAWRENLLRHARGKVLEVAVGAGNNFPFYPEGVEVTAVDLSSAMLSKAREAAKECGVKARFIHSDVESLEFSPDSFDTIVSTLSLCSYDDPDTVLDQFSRWCKHDGQILLMEHGISPVRPLAWLQEKLDPFLLRTFGCHHNRDILSLVRSRFSVTHHETRLLGMIHLIRARPDETLTS
jgi:ubiquinone/menaquinone biosynthesis C-methylase UbiE